MNAPGFGVVQMLIGAQAAQTNLTTTVGSTAATVASAAGLAIGQLIVGITTTPGTTIANLVGDSVTLSQPAITSGVVSAQFATVAFGDLPMPTFFSVAQGIAANLTVINA